MKAWFPLWADCLCVVSTTVYSFRSKFYSTTNSLFILRFTFFYSHRRNASKQHSPIARCCTVHHAKHSMFVDCRSRSASHSIFPACSNTMISVDSTWRNRRQALCGFSRRCRSNVDQIRSVDPVRYRVTLLARCSSDDYRDRDRHVRLRLVLSLSIDYIANIDRVRSFPLSMCVSNVYSYTHDFPMFDVWLEIDRVLA